MGEPAMVLGNEELKIIGEYVQSNLGNWIQKTNVTPFRSEREIDLLERMVRVEEGLKNISEQMEKGFIYMEKRFEQMEKRFEQIDKRFEQVDKRFEQVDKRFESFESRFNRITTLITVGFVVLGTLITVFKFVG